MEMTATPTATAPTTDPAGTAGVTPGAAGVGTPADVAVLLARLAQVTDQLAATIQAHTTSDGNGGGEGGGGGRVGMPTAGAILAATDRLTASVVAVLGSVSHRGVIADEGISAAAWLRTFAARTAADERMLANTVDRLADMPTVWALFCSGDLSWPVVRGVVAAVRSLTRAQRRWVDQTITADPDRVRRLDADDIVAAAERLADRARPDLHRDRERRAVERDRVYCQDGFDGSSYGSWELGPESAEVLRRALFATNPTHPATSRPDGDHHHGDTDTIDGGDAAGDHDGDADTGDGSSVEVDEDEDGELSGSDRWRQRRAWSNAQALLALCRQRLGEPGGSAPPPARPAMVVLVDIDALTSNPDGVGSATAQLLTRSARGPVELTPAAAQRLACDATLRYLLVDGATPLGATAAEPKVSATLHAALIARDGGCRFPGCRQPVDVCDTHHVVPRAQGGPTVLDNLVLLCLAHHHAVHDSGWTSRLHPDGTTSFTRRGVTITSPPHRDKRFTPTTPPPPGRPTRRPADGDRRDDEPPRHPAGDDPDPPPDVSLPF